MSLSINLKRPICFFDLETTGINIVNDRILKIFFIKINIDNNEESKTWLINPTIPIPPMTSAIHGITDEMVKDKPTLKKPQKKFSILYLTVILLDLIQINLMFHFS